MTGNHEFYVGLDDALSFTERAGFEILRGASRDVGGVLTIAGVDDPEAKGFGLRGRSDGEQDVLEGLPRDRFVLFLKHRPVVEEESLGLFDLQLSGHPTGGRSFPSAISSGCISLGKAGFTTWALPSLREPRSGTWGRPSGSWPRRR